MRGLERRRKRGEENWPLIMLVNSVRVPQEEEGLGEERAQEEEGLGEGEEERSPRGGGARRGEGEEERSQEEEGLG